MPSAEPLFRNEALSAKQAQWLGAVLLVPRPAHHVFALFAALSTSALLYLLFVASYTRSERVAGWLVPADGLVQVFAPMSGVVTRIDAAEGTAVKKGDILLALSGELTSAARGETQSQIALRLAARRDSLRVDATRVAALGKQQRASLEARIAQLLLEGEQAEREMLVQAERTVLARKSERRQKGLRGGDLISEEQLETAEQARLAEEARLASLERQRIATERQLVELRAELRELPLRIQAEVASLERTEAAVEQELAEAEARREFVVPAPASGTVTAIQVERGGRPTPGVPLLSIVPEGSSLVAHLFCPGRAGGFLRPGQRVQLRYEPYPYQKFGHHEGVVVSVSRTAINPAELPSRLVGLTSLYDAGEPMFRVTVRLARQTLLAYGEELALQPGTRLEADVLLERRRLYEWVLEPLFTLTGRWSR